MEIIAEAGTAHNGDLSQARELIHAAAEAGANTVKFQYILAREIIHPLTGSVLLPGGPQPLYDRFLALERPPEFYARLQEECRSRGIQFLCTPFGLESLQHLRELPADRLKIASPELNHLPLLKAAGRTGLPLLLSAGVSRLADIEEALDCLPWAEDSRTARGDSRSARGDSRSGEAPPPPTLLHCVTSYPAPEEDYNLNILPALKSLFGCPVGVSDHTQDPELIPLLALAKGASVLEKHITLKSTGSGLDDPIAQEPAGLARMVRTVRHAADIGEDEILRQAEARWGSARTHSVLGSGRKGLAPSEASHYGRTNRSIHAVTSLPAGRCLSPEDLALLRTEKKLRPGLHPRHLPLVLGRRISRPVPAGQGLQWEDLLSPQAGRGNPPD